MTRRVAAALALALSLGAPARARADVIERGTVVKVEAAEIYVNLGEGAGVVAGQRLRLKRPIKLKDPITRTWVEDWLPIGAATVTSVGADLTMAALEPELLSEIRTGDIAEIYVEREEPVAAAPAKPAPKPKPKPKPKPAPPPAPAPAPEAPLPEVDADTAAVLAVWQAQRGGSLDDRIAAWEGYLAAHAASPYAGAVTEDLALLRGLRDELARAPSAAVAAARTAVEHDAPTQGITGEPVDLVFVLDAPADVDRAWLHYRRTGDATFRRAPLAPENDAYLRAEVPGDDVAAPGLEYYLELVDPEGVTATVVPTTTVPVVSDGLHGLFAPRHPRTRVSTSASYLDFASFDRRDADGDGEPDHPDHLAQFEVDVTYRLPGSIAGVSVGLGVLDGTGGHVERAAEHIGYQYGYGEVEVSLTRHAGAAVRLVAGVDADGLGLGVEGRLRLGELDGSNLSFTASQLSRVGYLTAIRYEVWASPRVPVGLSVGVTDRPGAGEAALQLGVDLGLRTRSWLEPVLRVSYQGRTVHHSGLGAGLGLNFHW